MPTTDEQEQGVRQVYGEIAGVYEAFFPSLQRYEGRVERFLGETVAPGARVLDVGCGPGQLTRELEPTVQVVGLDLSPEMIELARRGRPSGEYRVHSYREPIPEKLGRFDVALAVGCLDFCDDLPRTLGHVSAALKPGGRLFFTVLERRPGLEGHEEALRQIQTADQEVTLYFWSFTETARALEAAGLLPRAYAHAPGWVQLMEQRTMHFGWWDVARR
ncbi:class I SAM-dependent methyltransferase [Archangium lansingense]|uniref:Class I SAM-dependent methyltransferase n=1 Tax=Archangium lansingense TaxID=2995310 RepID=A0ABT4ABB2_9BACT|nr:class I SAM-dependent methyltransferase [Archangium lansinium]MCY1078606.1 class I SAM-dependent methyltransferase [Archangium lansinium]